MSAPISANISLPWVNESYVGSTAVADVNGDGLMDVIIGYTSLDRANHAFPLKVLLSTGTGFRDGTSEVFGGTAPIVDGPLPILIGDFTRDGKADIIIGNGGLDLNPFPGARSTMLIGGASGLTDASARLPAQNTFVHTLSQGDIDRDGDLDVFYGNILGGSGTGPYFLINDGSGNFSEARDRLPSHVSSFDPGRREDYTASAMFDADGDGDIDLILGRNSDGGASRVMLNDGSGRFSDGAALPFGPNPTPDDDPVTVILTADLNGDGRFDMILNIAVDQYHGGHLQVLINAGGGNFVDETATRIITASGLAPGAQSFFVQPILSDVNGDGAMDLVIRSGSMNPVMINDGTGRFIALPEAHGLQNSMQYLTAGDFNADGVADYLVRHGQGVRAGGALDGTEQFTVTYGERPQSVQTGDAGANGLIGTKTNDALEGGGGNDVLVGFAGNDRLDGGDGNDRIHANEGNDSLDGGAGADYLRGEEGDDVVLGGAGADDIHGNQGNDTERGGDGDDWVVGGKDADALFGDSGFDIVYGNLGNDTCEGGQDNDWVRGGQGDDLINGGTGDDLLWGDKGSDTITGGAGADRFNTHGEAGLDRVLDFNFAEGDRIRVEFGSYTVSAQGGDTILDFGAGNQMVLVGVTGFDSGWIV